VEGLAWLWRLGPRLDAPAATAVGVGGPDDAGELAGLLRAHRLAGAVILAPGGGPAVGPLPARRIRSGTARFGSLRTEGGHTLFAEGRAVVRSSLGLHAIRDGDVLMLGAGAEQWGSLDAFWSLEAIAGFLRERLGRPLVALPPIGCLRLDDFPGTAELQLLGGAKPDARQLRRARALVGRLEKARARLVVAVAARALREGAEVPLDDVWPSAVAALADGVRRGVLEPACHGLLHLDPVAGRERRVDPREFARLDAAEAGRRLDLATAWLADHVGAPRSFVAPAWGYGAGALTAASARGLPTWLPPGPGPLLDGTLLRETLAIGLPGLHRLDYGPLRRLAAIGLPPTVVFHGRLLDDRLPRLRAGRDLAGAARLALRPDLLRIMRMGGIRWVGAAELVEALARHDRIVVTGDGVAAGEGPPPRLLT
jgi:hypothetical protein